MLVTRRGDTESSHWPFNKFEPAPRQPESPRMSDQYDSPLSTQPDWQGQYSYLGQTETGLFPFEQNHGDSEPAQPRSMTDGTTQVDVQLKREEGSPAVQHLRAESAAQRQRAYPSPTAEHPEAPQEQYTTQTGEPIRDESNPTTGTPQLSMGPNALNCTSPSGMDAAFLTRRESRDDGLGVLKEEDEEDMDDDELIEGDIGSIPQTAAERTAARRKMKRFRLTHQQTRFLMSEFAKQPHPDAAHRERLSREIPGLSPRQVQVWFQNRRAKIKRLTADDRDRMVKMRAVPDDFDNIQALHSPYGAVHGLGAPLSSPADFGGQTYGEHMMRPLLLDARRGDADDHISPTGLTPSFGTIGFNQAGTTSSPDLISPLSPNSNERYGYGSHISSPLSAGPRPPHSFVGRQNSLDTALQMGRQANRPLQPLHMRDSMMRSRSGSLQSPLRSAISWKGDSMDYTNSFHETNSNSALDERQQHLYQPNQTETNLSGGMEGFDASSYAGNGNSLQSASGLSYASMQHSSQTRSRLRAASASLPLNLDLRNQYRSGFQSPSVNSASRIPPSTSHYAGSSIYTTSYPTAPLTAPMDFSHPRSSNARPSAHDYSASQMSAPIVAPSDFSQAAVQGNLSGPVSRTPMRDSFSGRTPGFVQGQEENDSIGIDQTRPEAPRRGHSFGAPGGTKGSAGGSESRAYGGTT